VIYIFDLMNNLRSSSAGHCGQFLRTYAWSIA